MIELTDNEILNIELRNKDNEDIRTLLAVLRDFKLDMEDEMKEIAWEARCDLTNERVLAVNDGFVAGYAAACEDRK